MSATEMKIISRFMNEVSAGHSIEGSALTVCNETADEAVAMWGESHRGSAWVAAASTIKTAISVFANAESIHAGRI